MYSTSIQWDHKKVWYQDVQLILIHTQGMHELLAPVLFVMATEQREDIESDPTLS